MTRDPFDAVLDARSEARYEDDPSAEPDTREVAEANPPGGGGAWYPPIVVPYGLVIRG